MYVCMYVWYVYVCTYVRMYDYALIIFIHLYMQVVRNVMTHHYSPYSRNSSLDIPTVTTPTLLDPPVAQSVPTHLLSGQGSTNVTLDGSDGGGRGGGGGGGGGGGEESRGNGLDYTSVPSSPQREAILAKVENCIL